MARLVRSPAPYVILELPGGYPLLTDPLRVRGLRRAADDVHKVVALVSSQNGVHQAAKHSGVRVFLNCDLAKSVPWLATRPPALPQRPIPVAKAILPTTRVKRWAQRRLSSVRGLRSRWQKSSALLLRSSRLLSRLSWLLPSVLLLIAMPLLWYGYAHWLPSADVYLVAAHQPVSARVDLHASPSVDTVNSIEGAIPARFLEVMVSKTMTVPTTGKRWVPSGKAKGVAIFSNKLINEVPIPAGTEMSTGTGQAVYFHTTEDTVLPPTLGAKVRVPIEADNKGPVGNVPAFTITRLDTLLALQVQVINDQPTTGGGWKKVSVVTDEDKDKAHELIVHRLGQEAFRQFVQKQRQGEYIPLETVRTYVMAESYNHFRGEEANALEVKMRMLVRGIAVNTKAAQQVAYQKLTAQLPPAARLFRPHLKYEMGGVSAFDAESNTVYFTMRLSGIMVVGPDPHLVQQQVVGKTVTAARAILQENWALSMPPRILLGPAWLRTLPGWLQPGGGEYLPNQIGRIRVTVDLGNEE